MDTYELCATVYFEVDAVDLRTAEELIRASMKLARFSVGHKRLRCGVYRRGRRGVSGRRVGSDHVPG